MHTASTNICERLCNKSISDITLLLNYLATVNCSWYYNKVETTGTAATQPRSGRPHKMTERGQRMLKRTARRSRQLSAESIAKDIQTSCGL
ncbi:unnamed protein product [Staurois parvus]|uniref:Uncharacterized protein n=1 Tax=Staurois parvus TaxID=386267 RepID=A0ABN9FDL4_9NEOB|nr:unnamed protein product [Staurois parvus]